MDGFFDSEAGLDLECLSFSFLFFDWALLQVTTVREWPRCQQQQPSQSGGFCQKHARNIPFSTQFDCWPRRPGSMARLVRSDAAVDLAAAEALLEHAAVVRPSLRLRQIAGVEMVSVGLCLCRHLKAKVQGWHSNLRGQCAAAAVQDWDSKTDPGASAVDTCFTEERTRFV